MGETPPTDQKTTRPSRLLSLPTELRLRIYEYALTPTSVLCLTSFDTKRFATTPTVSPSLLATCLQINRECDQLLYTDNEICLVLDAHDTCWPVIAETRLPQPVLNKIEHMFMAFDCTSYFQASYEDVDFTSLTALTSLKSVRFAFMYEDMEWDPHSALVLLLEEVLMRLPKGLKILYEIARGSEQSLFLEKALAVRQSWKRNPALVGTLSALEIEMAVAAVDDSIRGSKNGTVEDVYEEYRDREQQNRWGRV